MKIPSHASRPISTWMRPRAPVLSSSRRDWLVTLVWGACMIMTMTLLPIAVLALALNGTAQLCAGPSSCDRIVAHFPGESKAAPALICHLCSCLQRIEGWTTGISRDPQHRGDSEDFMCAQWSVVRAQVTVLTRLPPGSTGPMFQSQSLRVRERDRPGECGERSRMRSCTARGRPRRM